MSQDNVISQHFYEVRYKALPKFFDQKGELLDLLKSDLLQHWQLSQDRIILRDKDFRNSAFLSHLNCGFTSLYPPTRNYFKDQGNKFLKLLFSHKLFKSIEPVRLGVKSIFIIPFKGAFEQLTKQYLDKYLNISSEAIKIFDAQIIDVGSPINFKAKDYFYNIHCGPMKKDQMSEFLVPSENPIKELPEVGLFFDIDCFISEFSKIPIDQLSEKIKEYSDLSWEKLDAVKKMIIG